MTMIDSLTHPQKAMIRTVVAGKPNYTQRQALATLGALERKGYVVAVDGKHVATHAGCALIEEDALRGQLSRHFHVGQKVEYSNWILRTGGHQHEWKLGKVSGIGDQRVSIRFEDGTYKVVEPRHIRRVVEQKEQS